MEEVELNTAPDEQGGTHWGQQVGFLESLLGIIPRIMSLAYR